MEEMSRYTGYWWTEEADDAKLAFLRVDESPVEVVTRNEIYADGIKLIDQRYPKPGKQNATVQLGVTRVTTESTPRIIDWVPLDPRLYDGLDTNTESVL